MLDDVAAIARTEASRLQGGLASGSAAERAGWVGAQVLLRWQLLTCCRLPVALASPQQ